MHDLPQLEYSAAFSAAVTAATGHTGEALAAATASLVPAVILVTDTAGTRLTHTLTDTL